VPVVVSPTLIEIYSGQFATSNNMPVIDTETAVGFCALRGASTRIVMVAVCAIGIGGSDDATPVDKERIVEAQVVGLSTKSMPIGLTMPLPYVRRWNKEFMGDEAASTYSSIVVTLDDPKELAPFAQWLKDKLDLRIEDSLGEKFSTVIFVIAVLFTIISIIIITISAINIAHNFFMQVVERRREIGVMRAVGATQNDVLLLIIGEAALIGLAGGILGVGLAVGVGSIVDWFSSTSLPRFPFKPASWFTYKPWIIGGGIGLSTLFCVVGGYLPARRASRMEPAAALAQN
jgi:putative ABC transport system permease protein